MLVVPVTEVCVLGPGINIDDMKRNEMRKTRCNCIMQLAYVYMLGIFAP